MPPFDRGVNREGLQIHSSRGCPRRARREQGAHGPGVPQDPEEVDGVNGAPPPSGLVPFVILFVLQHPAQKGDERFPAPLRLVQVRLVQAVGGGVQKVHEFDVAEIPVFQ
jgi:hypothetical protein